MLGQSICSCTYLAHYELESNVIIIIIISVITCVLTASVAFFCCRCNDVTMEFKAVSMARSVKGTEDPAFASRETFKARGLEHAFALNGHK